MYLTDRQLEATGLDPVRAETVVADAELLYRWVTDHPYRPHAEVALVAERRWGAEGPDRLAAAAGLLIAAGRLHEVRES